MTTHEVRELRKVYSNYLRKNVEKRTDHLGQVYDTTRKMCSAYNVSVGKYKTLISSGVTKQVALTAMTARNF